MKGLLLDIYQKLYDFYGPQYWWPGETPFEVIIGAILTQNTSWTNVEKAIGNLKRQGLLNAKSLRDAKPRDIADQIKPSGYYNIKTKRLKSFINFLFTEYKGDLTSLLNGNLYKSRKNLLSVNGIGEETADSILLYAGEKPIFVIDAYTKRILTRHKIIQEGLAYADVQKIFMDNLPASIKLFNEYHALMVRVGKERCNRQPKCQGCPLEGLQ